MKSDTTSLIVSGIPDLALYNYFRPCEAVKREHKNNYIPWIERPGFDPWAVQVTFAVIGHALNYFYGQS